MTGVNGLVILPLLPSTTFPTQMATASSWMPAAGRHNVSIGSSLSKALKARKGQPPTQRSKALPERDFYALRYNHKPASIDPSKPGTLEVNPGKEVTSVRVERPTTNVRPP
ncbi:hypothetical protein BJV74DRAFT_870688 [Russula compacta]|nr:hypothetical protein BJV74DRAFT_870688 [Russula compacta]